MSPTQVRAAEILLKKCIPDLSQIQGPGEGGEFKVEERIEMVIVDEAGSTKKA